MHTLEIGQTASHHRVLKDIFVMTDIEYIRNKERELLSKKSLPKNMCFYVSR
jgi:hypothetical protein